MLVGMFFVKMVVFLGNIRVYFEYFSKFLSRKVLIKQKVDNACSLCEKIAVV